MSVLVRATEPFRAYYAPTCQVLDVAQGDEFSGEVAVYLGSTGAAVEVVEDPDGAIEAAKSPRTPPAAAPTLEQLRADRAAVQDRLAELDKAIAAAEAEPAEASTPAAEAPAQLAAPTAKDGDSDEPFDPAAHNGPEVLAYAKDHPEVAEQIHAVEAATKARTTVLAGLADIIAGKA